jgi:hypothetical protein
MHASGPYRACAAESRTRALLAGRVFASIIGFGLGCLRSPGSDEEISAVRKVWPEYDIEWSRGAWHAYRIDGTGEPVTARTADTLGAAISADWGAGSMP